MKKCKIETCKNKVLSLYLCSKHYQRFKTYGNPTESDKRKGRPKTKKQFNCSKCNKITYKYNNQIINNKTGRYYCSRKCSYEDALGKIKNVIPLEYRKWRIGRKGYLETNIRRKRILQHRWIIETKVLKRPLEKGEIIHHLNGIKTDNRIENLSICSNHTHYLFIKALKNRIKELEIKLDSIAIGKLM